MAELAYLVEELGPIMSSPVRLYFRGIPSPRLLCFKSASAQQEKPHRLLALTRRQIIPIEDFLPWVSGAAKVQRSPATGRSKLLQGVLYTRES